MNIKIDVSKDFERFLDMLRCKYGEEFEILNGIHESQTDPFAFQRKFLNARNVADASIDSNANEGSKDIQSMQSAKTKSQEKLEAWSIQFDTMKRMFGLKVAQDWLEAEYSGLFYGHDAHTAHKVPYCFAYDLTRLAEEGLFFIDNYNNQPPKHLTTFFDDVIEYISYMSNRSSGAVGVPNILIWSYYFWKHDCENGYFIKSPEYYAKQNFQKLIYRLNQPFMRITQCAFTNVSVFDRKYVEALFGGVTYPDGTYVIDQVEEIMEHQKLFMEVVSQIRTENLFTYPVLTFSLLYKDGRFQDEEFARWASDHNTKWNDSNFFVSSDVSTLSNCCFAGDQELYYYDADGNKIWTTFEQFVESRLPESFKKSAYQVIQPCESAYVKDPVSGKMCEISAVSKLPNKHNRIIEIELENGEILKVTPDQKIYDKASQKLVTAEEILADPDKFDI